MPMVSLCGLPQRLEDRLKLVLQPVQYFALLIERGLLAIQTPYDCVRQLPVGVGVGVTDHLLD